MFLSVLSIFLSVVLSIVRFINLQTSWLFKLFSKTFTKAFSSQRSKSVLTNFGFVVKVNEFLAHFTGVLSKALNGAQPLWIAIAQVRNVLGSCDMYTKTVMFLLHNISNAF